MENDLLLLDYLHQEFSLELSPQPSMEEISAALAGHINHLIDDNFQQLIRILYRIDISESRLRSLLTENQEADAGSIIADLIIERQLQKIASRKQYRQNGQIPDDEKW
ncbi:MAG TPA: hypothetical protein VMI35_00910 [Puia sp.]|nr:hypothetical protein [Puia sp.]